MILGNDKGWVLDGDCFQLRWSISGCIVLAWNVKLIWLVHNVVKET